MHDSPQYPHAERLSKMFAEMASKHGQWLRATHSMRHHHVGALAASAAVSRLCCQRRSPRRIRRAQPICPRLPGTPEPRRVSHCSTQRHSALPGFHRSQAGE